MAPLPHFFLDCLQLRPRLHARPGLVHETEVVSFGFRVRWRWHWVCEKGVDEIDDAPSQKMATSFCCDSTTQFGLPITTPTGPSFRSIRSRSSLNSLDLMSLRRVLRQKAWRRSELVTAKPVDRIPKSMPISVLGKGCCWTCNLRPQLLSFCQIIIIMEWIKVSSRAPVAVNAGSAETGSAEVLLDCRFGPSCECGEICKAGRVVVVRVPEWIVGRCLSAGLVAAENRAPHVPGCVDAHFLAFGLQRSHQLEQELAVAVRIVAAPRTAWTRIRLHIHPHCFVQVSGNAGCELIGLRGGIFSSAGEHVCVSFESGCFDVGETGNCVSVHSSERTVASGRGKSDVVLCLHAGVVSLGEELGDVDSEFAVAGAEQSQQQQNTYQFIHIFICKRHKANYKPREEDNDGQKDSSLSVRENDEQIIKIRVEQRPDASKWAAVPARVPSCSLPAALSASNSASCPSKEEILPLRRATSRTPSRSFASSESALDCLLCSCGTKECPESAGRHRRQTSWRRGCS